jgi:hypothetical protein
VILLLALAIVAWLAKDALTKYGLVPDMETVEKRAGTAAERARTPAGSATERLDPAGAASVPTKPLDAARNLEKSLQEQSEKRGGGY